MRCEKSFINDKSEELVDLYQCVKKQDGEFLEKLEWIYRNWTMLGDVVEHNLDQLCEIYEQYCNAVIQERDMKEIKREFENIIEGFTHEHAAEFDGILTPEYNIDIRNFKNELKRNFISKMNRMYKIEQLNSIMLKEEKQSHIECAFKSAYYMHFRYLYNEGRELGINPSFYTAIFYFIREFCYAAMFRYNKNGKFNVPYGGKSYNRKEFQKKIDYLKSEEIKDYMKNTQIYCNDFEDFLNQVNPQENDFIFLDPPYDSEFSTYAKNEFNKEDQIRLRDWLRKTKADFMMIVKETDFMRELYEPYFDITRFNKKYLVSFRNRNDRNTGHLIITNYKINQI